MGALRTRTGSILLACTLWAYPVAAEDCEAVQTIVPGNVWQFDGVRAASWHGRVLIDAIELLGLEKKGLFKGDASLSRYRFAEALAQVLDALERQLEAGSTAVLTGPQLDALTRLAQEFEVELTGLHANTTRLDRRVAQVGESLFSPFAKLDGSLVMGIAGGIGCTGCSIDSGTAEEQFPSAAALGDALGALNIPIRSANTSFVARTTLRLSTSFSGRDELRLRLRGVTGEDIGTALEGIASGIGVLIFSGSPDNTAFDGSSVGISNRGNANLVIDEIRYVTPLFGDDFRIFFGPRLEVTEYLDTNSFANNEELDFTGGLFTNNPLLTFVFAGAGLGFDWDLSEVFSLRSIYLSANGGAAAGDSRRDINPFGAALGAFGAGGLFGGEAALLSEFEIRPGPGAAIRLQYGRQVEQGGIVDTLALPELIQNSTTDALGLNVEWAVTPSFALFGRYGWGSTTVRPLPGVRESFTQINLNTWQLGVTFSDLGGVGNALGLSVAQPLRVFAGSGTGLVEPGLTSSLVPSGLEHDLVIFYRYRLSDRVSITPLLQFVEQPVSARSSNGLTIGGLRAVFSF